MKRKLGCQFASSSACLLLLLLLLLPLASVQGYTVTQTDSSGSKSQLQLKLLDPFQQSLLPQYGPGFTQLAVTSERISPSTLRVKIAPLNEQRWEIPETLLPRPQATPFAASNALYSLQLPKQGEPFQVTVNRQQPAAEKAAAAAGKEQAAVFDSSGSRLVFKRKYIEWSTRLHPNTTLYGFGQHVQSDGSLKLPRGGVRLTLWNRAASSGHAFWQNLYGSHPFFLQVAQDGLASGVLLLNSNAMDVQLEQTRLTYKVVGGVLDFYVFMGPGPEAVLQQYQAVVGRPAMPPYWTLGFHNSRWGYDSVAELRNVSQQYKAAGIPLEVVWSDIDHMDRYREFTFNPVGYPAAELAAYVSSLHAAGQRWVPIIDCGIPVVEDDAAYQQGIAADVFIKDVAGKPFTGQVWPGATHFPDFLHKGRTWPWWQRQLARMYSQVKFDGLWIDMNEPTNFCSKGDQCHLPQTSPLYRLMRTPAAQASSARLSDYLTCALECKLSSSSSSSTKQYKVQSGMTFISTQRQMQLAAEAAAKASGNSTASNPAKSGARRGSGRRRTNKWAAAASVGRVTPLDLSHRTVPMSAKGLDGTPHYDTHNLYGWAEAAATYDALAAITKKRPFVLTRSTFAGSGRWAAHWSGDNRADWVNLQWSVPALLQSNIWGMPLAGSDICGFSKQPSEELCARWISAGAFYTFSRTHKAYGGPGHEMYRWESVARAARKALGMRYQLLPYLYSAFHSAHTQGGSVAKPLFFPFPADATARDVSDQWLLGDSVLVSPVLHKSSSSRRAYFPPGVWHDLWAVSIPTAAAKTGNNAGPVCGPKMQTLDVPLGDVPLHVRGGSIVPMQSAASTTTEVRSSRVTLVVALEHEGAKRPTASTPERCAAFSRSAATQHNTAAAAAAADESDAELAAVASSVAAAAAAGNSMRIVACGQLYVDDGESLQVPPAQGYLLTQLTAAATADYSEGLLSSLPVTAAATAVAGAGSADGVAEGAAHETAAAAAAHTEEVTTAAAAGFKAPALEAVVILGLPNKAAGGADAWAVKVNGNALSAGQVQYDAARQVLRLSGLQQQLAKGCAVRWERVA